MATLDQDAQDKLYIRGFNSGYMVAKYEPDLAAKIVTYKNEHSHYFTGFVLGKEEFEREAREWAKSFAKGKPPKDDRGLDKAK
jgi:hypothetical protein